MSTLTTIQAADLITNSRADINGNFAALNSEKLETSVVDSDTALTANSDSKVATQKAVKAYVDALGSLTVKTSGVSAGPASSSTQTITHSLGRIPTVIRVNGFGSSNSTTSEGGSVGTYNSTGNRCVYTLAKSGSRNAETATTYAIRIAVNASGSETNVTTGVIQNVTATTFDIAWTAAGDVSSCAILWEAN